MKKIETAVMASILALVFGFTPLSIYAHGNEHQEEMMFDPVENEFGSYEPKLQITRTIKVEMTDHMRFTPDMIQVKKGDVIKFEHTNTGQIMHEFVLCTPTTLDEHAEMMKKFPGMEHSEPYMAHVPPGETKTIIWKFSKAGEFAFGCLIPGHYDAGMKGRILVGS